MGQPKPTTNVRKKFDEIWDIANESIIENERVVDNQTVYISIGILINLIAISLKTPFNFLPIHEIILFILLCSSFASLLLCVLVPTIVVSKRRESQDELRSFEKNNDIDNMNEENLKEELKNISENDIDNMNEEDLKEKLKNIKKLENIKELENISELEEIEQRYVRTAHIDGCIKISRMEKARLFCIVLTIVLSFIFYLMMLYCQTYDFF